MTNEVVKYHNDLNRVVMRDWNSSEMNIFFGIISRIREQDSKELTLSIKTIRELTQSNDAYQKNRWYENLKSVVHKLSTINFYREDEKTYELLLLFQKFKINKDDETILVKVSPDFDYILNQLNANFTNWDLIEFKQVKSSYSKTLFRLLKQYRTVGKRRFTVNEFRTLLDIPESYNTGMVKKRIIDKSIIELSEYLKDLKCKSITENTQGNPVIAYEFTFKAEKTSPFNPNKYKKKMKKNELKPYWANERNGSSQQSEKAKSQLTETEIREELQKTFKINK